jgi:hypothetical protein
VTFPILLSWLQPWRWRQYVSPKHWHLLTSVHGAKTQKNIGIRIIIYEGWSKTSGTELIVGRRKHLQVTRSYLLQSTTLQIVCSDSSDSSTFQCMSGRLVWKWPATAVWYLVVSPRRLEIVSPSGGRGRSRRGPNLVSKADGEPRGCCAWPRIPGKPGNKFCRHAFHSKILRQYRLACAKWQVVFISNLSDRQTSVPTDYCIDTVVL